MEAYYCAVACGCFAAIDLLENRHQTGAEDHLVDLETEEGHFA